MGFLWAGKLPFGLDYGTEIAVQSGTYAGDSIGAWFEHFVVGETLPDARHRPRFFLEYARASGDANPKDGRHGTFDGLFPSTHDKYGLNDLICASNIVYLRPGFQFAVRPGLTLGVAYNDYWLASARDGLYLGGKMIARSAGARRGRTSAKRLMCRRNGRYGARRS